MELLRHPPQPRQLLIRRSLAQLAAEARQKLREIDASLVEKGASVSPGELSARGIRPSADRPSPEREVQVLAAFRRYDRLADDYHEVPVVAGEIKSHVAKQRRRWEFAAVLNEPEAKALWEVAQQHEAEDHRCCAYFDCVRYEIVVSLIGG